VELVTSLQVLIVNVRSFIQNLRTGTKNYKTWGIKSTWLC